MDQAQMLFVSQCKHPTVTTLRAVCTSQASKKKKKHQVTPLRIYT
jgi:hypothetical protein